MPRGSRAFGSLWGSRLSSLHWSFFNLLIWAFFLFLPSFLVGFKACPFMAFGLQVFWAYYLFFNSIFYGPLCCFFGPRCCDFLDLNTHYHHNIGRILIKLHISYVMKVFFFSYYKWWIYLYMHHLYAIQDIYRMNRL